MKNKKILSFVACVLSASILMSSCSAEPSVKPVDNTSETAAISVENTEDTEASEDTSSTEETVEESTEMTRGPSSTAVVTEKAVEVNGQLSVSGTNIVNEYGETVQLRGMSCFELQGAPGFVTEETVQTLAEDWGCTVFRLPMICYENDAGYCTNRERYLNEICEYIDICLAQGIYVIVDWHNYIDGDPNRYKDDSIEFFGEISSRYGDEPGIIYEICNEPSGARYDDMSLPVDWECVKSYAVDVIDTIRANDPDNIIIVGTPNWSYDVDVASEDPIDGENIMYSVHFYAGDHGQENRDKVQTAIDNGVAVFCTEWGATRISRAGVLFLDESREWLDFFAENNISWCNWSIGGNSAFSTNALRMPSTQFSLEEKYAGHWPDEFISESGMFVREILLESYYEEQES